MSGDSILFLSLQFWSSFLQDSSGKSATSNWWMPSYYAGRQRHSIEVPQHLFKPHALLCCVVLRCAVARLTGSPSGRPAPGAARGSCSDRQGSDTPGAWGLSQTFATGRQDADAPHEEPKRLPASPRRQR